MFNIFFSKSVPFINNVEKYCRTEQATLKYNACACWIYKTTNTHTQNM